MARRAIINTTLEFIPCSQSVNHRQQPQQMRPHSLKAGLASSRLAGYEDGTSEELALLQRKANGARYAISNKYLGLLAPATHPNGHYV